MHYELFTLHLLFFKIKEKADKIVLGSIRYNDDNRTIFLSQSALCTL